MQISLGAFTLVSLSAHMVLIAFAISPVNTRPNIHTSSLKQYTAPLTIAYVGGELMQTQAAPTDGARFYRADVAKQDVGLITEQIDLTSQVVSGAVDHTFWKFDQVDTPALPLQDWFFDKPDAQWPAGGPIKIEIWIGSDGALLEIRFLNAELPDSVRNLVEGVIFKSKFSPALKNNRAVQSYRAIELKLDE
jgi:hypothetical protein